VVLWPETDKFPYDADPYGPWLLPAVPVVEEQGAQSGLPIMSGGYRRCREQIVFMYWCGERQELEQLLGRPSRPEDVINLLCRPVSAEILEEACIKRKIISASNRRRELFTHMVEVIIGRKEELVRERQTTG